MKKLLLAMVLLSGCGTIIGTEERGVAPYRGVVTDFRYITKEYDEGGLVFFFDIPLSLAVDTAMLPFSIVFYGVGK